MSINVTVVGTTNVVASVAETTIGVSVGSPGSVDVGIGTMVAQAVTGLLVAGGNNVTVTTTSGVFTIAAADAPVSSVNGKTGAVVLNATDVGAASNTHGHSYVQSLNSLTGTLNVLAGSNITISTSSSGITIVGSAGGGTTGGAVSSVNGRTGTITLVSTDVSAASASHTHVVANITDFATEAAKYGPVSSVNGRTGTVTIVASDVSAASTTHAHSYVQSLNSQTGTLSILAGDNVTISTSAGFITITGSAGGTGGGSVTSVNGRTGAVTLVSTDVSAASAVHTHVAANITDFATEAAKVGPVSSVNGRTGTVTLVASDVSAASASHTHVAANITDFVTEAAKFGPVSSVNGRTGTVTLVSTDVSAASASHTHVAANITDFSTEAAKVGPVSSVNGRTGTVTLVSADVSAASASHTHVAADVTDFVTEAAKYGPVSSVNGRTGTVTLVATDVSAASSTHAHSYVQSLNSQTGTLSILAGDNVTISTSAGFITITGAAAGTAGSSVTSVNGKSGQVTISASDVTAAGAYIWNTIEATANLNDHSPGTATVLRISANSANRSITGFSGGGENKALRLINVATNILTLVHNSTASDSTNRLLLDAGTNRTLDENDQAELLYDPVSMRWRVTPCCGASS